MIMLLYLAGILSIIGGLVLGLTAGTFAGFIAAFIGGILTSLIFFALAKILDHQEYICDSLAHIKKQADHACSGGKKESGTPQDSHCGREDAPG